ncbi:MAG: agmatine deiminase family protein, partial [Synechococcus sp.]|nr:agmatine deiminase family protein [Synechococcus sp.]
MAWPRADGDWAPYLPAVRACYRELCAAISRHAPVLLLSATPEATAQELGHLGTGRLRVWASPAQDTWTRDYGPITVLESRGPEGEAPLLLDFRFNGW